MSSALITDLLASSMNCPEAFTLDFGRPRQGPHMHRHIQPLARSGWIDAGPHANGRPHR